MYIYMIIYVWVFVLKYECALHVIIRMNMHKIYASISSSTYAFPHIPILIHTFPLILW